MGSSRRPKPICQKTCCTLYVGVKGADPFLNTRTKIEDVQCSHYKLKGHSRESKASLKSRDTRMPGMLCVLVYTGIFHNVDYETDIFSNIALFYKTGLVRVY